MNVTLIGMAGAGKSTIGRVLATRLNYQFIDIDTVIVNRLQKTPGDILAQQGTDGVLELERQLTDELSSVTQTVIAPGGSIVYIPEAMETLKRISKVIWLAVPLNVVKQRISDFKDRGVVGLRGTTLEEIFAERQPLYRRYADATITYEPNFRVGEYVDRIIHWLAMSA